MTTLSEFRASGCWSDTPADDFPGHGFSDYRAGMVYGGNADKDACLLIQAIDTLADKYAVELFGDDFVGGLANCEAELWHAARVEGVIK